MQNEKKTAITSETIHSLPDEGLLRLHQIIGNPKASPPIPAIIPISKSSWWACVKSGKFPKPIKLGSRTTAWRVKDIRLLYENSCDRGSV